MSEVIRDLEPDKSAFTTMLMRLMEPHLTNIELDSPAQIETALRIGVGGWLPGGQEGRFFGRIHSLRFERPDDWFDRGRLYMQVEKPWLKPPQSAEEKKIAWLEDELMPVAMSNPAYFRDGDIVRFA